MVKFNDEQIAKLGEKLRKDFARPRECPTDNDLLDCALESMSAGEKDRLNVHLDACASCTEALGLMIEAAKMWDAGVRERVLTNVRPALKSAAATVTSSSSNELRETLVERVRAAIVQAITPRRVQFAPTTTSPFSKWEEGGAVGDITYSLRRGEDDMELYFYTPLEEFIGTSYSIEMGSDGSPNWAWQGETTFIECETMTGIKASAYLLIDREERLRWPDDARIMKLTPRQGE